MTTASELVPDYPGSDASPEKRDSYWGWFARKFNEESGADRKALRAVENAVKDHRIAWIDYRVPLGEDGGPPFLHLHLQARGEFDTGVFAYNLISRGLKHGVRIVGTLKSEPDLNHVLLTSEGSDRDELIQLADKLLSQSEKAVRAQV